MQELIIKAEPGQRCCRVKLPGQKRSFSAQFDKRDIWCYCPLRVSETQHLPGPEEDGYGPGVFGLRSPDSLYPWLHSVTLRVKESAAIPAKSCF